MSVSEETKNMATNPCPCCSGVEFDHCCGPLLSGMGVAASAEALMRSRYTAYATGNIEYLNETLHPEFREDHDLEATRRWANNADWIRLEIINSTDAGAVGEEDEVEFIATYREKGLTHSHHELGRFRKHNGLWYFVEGRMVPVTTQHHRQKKPGRNDPCPCGSGKKYKKCCLT